LDYKSGNWIPEKKVEDIFEKDVLKFLKSKGIDAEKVKRGSDKTSDYEWKDVAIEVTTVHDFDPPFLDPTKEFLANNPCNYYVTYAYSDEKYIQPKCEIIFIKTVELEYSILKTRQHILFYCKKIINEIDKKSEQAWAYTKEIIVLDFRTAPFRPITLVKEIHSILNLIGNQYSSLVGIIVVTKEHDFSSIDKMRYIYIRKYIQTI
jgi:hypothetical protein